MNTKEKSICQKIYEENHKKINWYIWKHYAWLNEEDRYDIMQDLWKALCQNITNVSARTEGGQWAWLVTVIDNNVVSLLRKNGRDEKLEEKIQFRMKNMSEDKTIENKVVDKILAEKILDKLSTEEKRILFEKHLHKPSQYENRTSKTQGNALTCKVYRTRKKLEKHMKEGGMDD